MTDTLHLSHCFGSTKRKGAWEVPEHVVLRQRMGSAQLDFTSAAFASAHTLLDLDMIGGSVELRVPDDMPVDAGIETTLASFEDHRKTDPAGPDAPRLTLTGRAVWGSVEVRGPKRRRRGN